MHKLILPHFLDDPFALAGLWGLINNAGKLEVGIVEWQSLESFKSTADVNLWGTILVTQTFLPLVKKSRGRVINMGSILGETYISTTTETNFMNYKMKVKIRCPSLERPRASNSKPLSTQKKTFSTPG